MEAVLEMNGILAGEYKFEFREVCFSAYFNTTSAQKISQIMLCSLHQHYIR